MRHFFILFILFVGLVYGQYTNTNGKVIDKPFSELLKWRKNSSEPNLSYIETSNEWQQAINSDKDFFIWIGHATFLIKVNNKVILTDPIFSERASPFKRFGPKRLINTPLSVSDIPNVDIVTISHNHYDHLDIPSLKKISKQFKNVSFFVPEGDKRLLIKNNIDNYYYTELLKVFKKHKKNIKIIIHSAAQPSHDWAKNNLRCNAICPGGVFNNQSDKFVEPSQTNQTKKSLARCVSLLLKYQLFNP